MSEPPGPREEARASQRTRVRKRVRVRAHRPLSHRLRRWWDKYGGTAMRWGGFAVAVAALTLLVLAGYIRSPAPAPPQ